MYKGRFGHAVLLVRKYAGKREHLKAGDGSSHGFTARLSIGTNSIQLMTSIAALQCVERGLLELDGPISAILPEWSEPQIIIGFDADNKVPKLRPATKFITLRHLLSHSSGMAYPLLNPLLNQYCGQSLGTENKSIKDQYLIPLIYEPGEGWEYGPGIDWAGKMVERVNSGMKLGDILQKNVWDPLGMESTTFHPLQRPEIMKRMVGRTRRTETGSLTKDETEMFLVSELEDDFGGDGTYSSARDFTKILTSLLMNDGVLLGPEMREELFKGQLAHPEAFKARAEDPVMGGFLAPGLPRDQDRRWDYGCGGAVLVSAVEGQAGKELLYWSGLPNSFWVSQTCCELIFQVDTGRSSSIVSEEHVDSTAAGCCLPVTRLLANSSLLSRERHLQQ